MLIHTSHLFEEEGNPSFRLYKKAKELGAKIIVDAGWADPPDKGILEARLMLADVLFGTKDEICRYLSRLESQVDCPREAVERMLDYVPLVVLKRGSEGSIIGNKTRKGRNIVTIDPIPVEEIIHLSGAGDAYAGAFIATLNRTNNLYEAGYRGSLAAAQVISSKNTFLTNLSSGGVKHITPNVELEMPKGI